MAVFSEFGNNFMDFEPKTMPMLTIIPLTFDSCPAHLFIMASTEYQYIVVVVVVVAVVVVVVVVVVAIVVVVVVVVVIFVIIVIYSKS